MDIISPLSSIVWDYLESLVLKREAILEHQKSLEGGGRRRLLSEAGLSTLNLFLNLSTHPTPLRRKGGPHQGKGFVASQVFLAYEFDTLLYNKEGDVEP